MKCIWLWMKHFEAWVHARLSTMEAFLFVRFLQVSTGGNSTERTHTRPPAFFSCDPGRVSAGSCLRSDGLTPASKCKLLVVLMKCSVNQCGRASLLSLQIEIDVVVCEDGEESCPRWSGSKRRRQVLIFDVHPSRRTPRRTLDYTPDRYASESEVHLGMG